MQFSSRRGQRRELPDINVTSLVDIIFNLLIFFMLTTSFSDSAGLEIELPEASAAEVTPTNRDMPISILEDGSLILGGESVDMDQLEGDLKRQKEKHPKGMVLLQADKGVPHGRVVEVVNLVKKVGIKRLGIATQGGG